MFKEKSSKKRLPLTESHKELTLDARHQRTLDEIAEKRARISNLRAEYAVFANTLENLQVKIQDLVDRQVVWDDVEYETVWSSNLLCKDRIRYLEREINRLESGEDEITYFENTAAILFSYYDLLQLQGTSEHTSVAPISIEKPLVRGRKKHLPPQNKSILEAFNLITATASETPGAAPESQPSCATGGATAECGGLSGGASTCAGDKRALVEKYMALTDPTFIQFVGDDAAASNCPKCDTTLLCMLQDGIMVCAACGYQELMLVEQNKPTQRQPMKEASHFSYKRINHFNEWLSQIQGKESTDIPQEIFERIVSEIHKEKISDTSKITYSKMREILKKLKLNKFYEHGPYIISRINGMPTPNFTPDLEDKLRSMFKEIQAPFLKHCPKDRKNFLSYSYVLYKFFQLLERDEYLKHFPLLKSREKLHLQDQIWKNICEELHWQFMQSI